MNSVDKYEKADEQKESKNMTDEQKIFELSLIWKEAEYNFAFWNKFDKNFNWDEQYKIALSRVLKTKNLYTYYLELMRFVALLKDGHTDVWFPKEIYESEEFSAKLPLELAYINNEYIIVNVKKSVEDRVKRYSKIKKINGVDIDDYIEKNIYPYIWHEKKDSCFYGVRQFIRSGAINSEVELVLEYDGKVYTEVLKRTTGDTNWVYDYPKRKEVEGKIVFKSDSHTIKMTEDGIAIIAIKTMMNKKLPEEIRNNYDILKQAKAFIIDIRDNGGGNSGYSDVVASLFIGSSFRHDNAYHPYYIAPYKAWGLSDNMDKLSDEEFYQKYPHNEFREKCYQMIKHTYYENYSDVTKIVNVPGKLEGQIIILSNEYTASAAENFINVMKYYTNAKIIGTASYGSTGQPLTYHLESGGGFRICTRRSKALDESEFINIGFIPDIECRPTLEEYQTGIDVVMNKALEEIRKTKSYKKM